MKIPPLPLSISVVAATVVMTATAIPLLRGTLFYPQITAVVAQDLQMDFASHGLTSHSDCTASLDKQVTVLKRTCPACRITSQRCVTSPDPSFFTQFSEEPLAVASGRHADGVVLYSSADQALALAVCRETERQTALAEPRKGVNCFAPGTPRPRHNKT